MKYGTIEVLALSKSGVYAKISRRGANPIEWIRSDPTQRVDLKWDDEQQAYVGRKLRLPVGDYIVSYEGNEEWVRVHEDDVTVVDYR